MPKPSDVVSIDPKLLMEELIFKSSYRKMPHHPSDWKKAHSDVDHRRTRYRLPCDVLQEHGFNITINTVNLMFMIAGLCYIKRQWLICVLSARQHAVRRYSGAIPLLRWDPTDDGAFGLGGLITEFFINVANKDTFP